MYPTETIEPFNWNTLEPLFAALLQEDLTAQQVPSWLNRWSDLEKALWEARAHLKRDSSWDETNIAAQNAFQRFTEEVFSPYQLMNQALKTKLLALPDYVPAPEHLQMLRFLRAEANLFRKENVPLQAEIASLSSDYGRQAWNMLVRMNGETIPLPQVEERATGQDQAMREQAWRLTWTHWHE